MTWGLHIKIDHSEEVIRFISANCKVNQNIRSLLWPINSELFLCESRYRETFRFHALITGVCGVPVRPLVWVLAEWSFETKFELAKISCLQRNEHWKWHSGGIIPHPDHVPIFARLNGLPFVTLRTQHKLSYNILPGHTVFKGPR